MSGDEKFENPFVTADTLCLRYYQKTVQLLLIQRKNPPFKDRWALPGGFVEPEETLRESAIRELEEETGVQTHDISYFRTYGDPGRDPRGRVVTVCFLALLPPEGIEIRPDTDAKHVAWKPLYELPPLAFDHTDIVDHLRQHLERQIQKTDLAFDFLSGSFSIDSLFTLIDQTVEPEMSQTEFKEQFISLPFVSKQTTGTGESKDIVLYTVDREEASEWFDGQCFWDWENN